MAARVVWLVGTGAVRPDQVLGLTFTNKAAAELAVRVRSALALLPAGPEQPAEGRRAELPVDGEPTVATYHAYAGRLLRDHGLRIGVEPGARLLADATRFQLAERVLRRASGPFETLDKTVPYLVGDIVALDGELSEHLVATAPAARPRRGRRGARSTRCPSRSPTSSRPATPPGNGSSCRGWSTCSTRRSSASASSTSATSSRRPSDWSASTPPSPTPRSSTTASSCSTSTRTPRSPRRCMLTSLFGDGHPVTAVGDPCQAIYGWRGASVGNIDAFPADFPTADGSPAARYDLAQNNRSGGLLLQLANALSADLRAAHPGLLELAPRPGVEADGRTVVGLFERQVEEVEWVADSVARQLQAPGVRPRDIAVLVRVRADFAPYHDALVARGVPVEVVGLGGLLALPEVADLVATLDVLVDATANASLVRLLTGPRWRIGPRDLVAARPPRRRPRPRASPATPTPTTPPTSRPARTSTRSTSSSCSRRPWPGSTRPRSCR